MGVSLPSFPYPPEREGYWGAVTSTLNWCEEDYYATPYAAEIVNSFTNLAFVYLAYRGIASCIRNGHDKVFLFGFVSYLIIGLGSFLFHATLKYEMQLLDELSMIYTTCVLFYAIFAHRKSVLNAVLTGVFITFVALFITSYYYYIKDPLFHQNAFALLTAIVFFRSLWGMEATLRPSLRNKRPDYVPSPNKAEQARRDRRDVEILRFVWRKMIPVGMGSIALGFLIWNLDNIFCPTIRRWRHQVGLPWGILLEGHGWWHLFTGIAQYFNITWSIWMRYCVEGKQDDFEMVWPSMFTSVPAVERSGYSRSTKPPALVPKKKL